MAEAGELEPWIVEDNERSFSQVASAPGYQAWFQIRAHYFNDDFRGYIERLIAVLSHASDRVSSSPDCFLRLNSGVGLLLRVTDVERQPFRSIGFVSVIIAPAQFALGLPLVLL